MSVDSQLSVKVKINPRQVDQTFTPTYIAPPPELGELLWGRIILALLLVVGLLAGLAWGGWRLWESYTASPLEVEVVDQSEAHSQVEVPTTGNAEDVKAAAEVEEVAAEEVQAPDVPDNAAGIEQVSDVLDPAAVSAQEENLARADDAAQNVDTKEEVDGVKASAHVLPPKETAAPVKVSAEVVTTFATVDVKSPLISRAALSAHIRDREPVGQLPARLSLSSEEDGLLKVYFFTDYAKAKDKVLYHDWYRNGKRVARVKSKPTSQLSRVYSSKFIDKNLLGDWQVRVVTAKGETLADGQFTVIR